MMAEPRRFKDPLYAFRSEDEAPQALVRKKAQQARQIRQWTLLSIAGIGAIAGLVWMAWPTEHRAVGASTDAFARDDGRGRMLGQGKGGSTRAGAAQARADRPSEGSSGGMLGQGRAHTAERPAGTTKSGGSRPSGWASTGETIAANQSSQQSAPGRAATPGPSGLFRRCTGGITHCVIDGGQFRWGNRIVELADVEVPNPRVPACQEEAILGARSLARLAALLNEGPFVISDEALGTGKRGAERYIVTREGVSIGTVLIEEGLARPPGAGMPRWC
jgi:endonuclease YncB( thermonuclease family)